MRETTLSRLGAMLMLTFAQVLCAADNPLAVGVAGHAFDHLGAFPEQADAALASGANIIYATGVGSLGYSGLPPQGELAKEVARVTEYTKQAKAKGIRLALGYLCATSIVKLETFDKNWPEELRKQFETPPSEWMQRGRDGKALPSWYGGEYRPACMSNPDWRTYEKHMLKLTLETGHDGVFFDNPTVHPQGCYCEHCMAKFARVMKREGESIEKLRELADRQPKEFLRFRASISSDFLKEMRDYVRSINPNALVTCNNSLNSPDVFFSQARTYGYNIHAMSEVEDLIVVEDMGAQPRKKADGSVVEYGPMYEMLHAIGHGKPLVAVTLADGDYHTPPNLVRLAMAEAAAHGASYLSWPTWPENVRKKMAEGIAPQAKFLRENAELLNGTTSMAHVCVFLPWRRWVESADCPTLGIVNALSAANVQFEVATEDNLEKSRARLLVMGSPPLPNEFKDSWVKKFEARGGRVVCTDDKDWMKQIGAAVVLLNGPPTVRAIARQKGNKTIVHLLNLDIEKISSFEDRVSPVKGLRVTVVCPPGPTTTARLLTADGDKVEEKLEVGVQSGEHGRVVWVTIPRLDISALLVIE